MRILFVTPPPYLPNRLHRNRSFDLIKLLSKNHGVYLLSVTTYKEESKEFREIKKVCKSVKIIYLNPIKAILNCLRFPFLPSEVAYCYSEKAEKEIQKIIKSQKIDLVYLKRLRSAIYLPHPNPHPNPLPNGEGNLFRSLPKGEGGGEGIKVILDTTDAMSMFYFRLYKRARFPKKLFYIMEAVRYKWFEREIAKKIKNWIACSEIDRKYLQKIGGDVNIHLIPNPVDTEYFSPTPPPRSRFRNTSEVTEGLLRGEIRYSLLFRGLMDKPVNINACLFFVKEILPLVKHNIKDVKLFIVGPSPHRLIQKLHNGKDIFVTGFVKDVREFIRRTSISICPVRIGAGTRHKILQAWAMGKPVVSTTIGAEGLLYKRNKNIAIGDTPKEFAKQIISILKNRRKYDKLAENGRKTAVMHYGFKVIGQKIETLIQNVNSPKRHSGKPARRGASRISNGYKRCWTSQHDGRVI